MQTHISLPPGSPCNTLLAQHRHRSASSATNPLQTNPLQTHTSSPAYSHFLQVRERLRSALTRLVANDAFVDMVAAELKAVGLMH